MAGRKGRSGRQTAVVERLKYKSIHRAWKNCVDFLHDKAIPLVDKMDISVKLAMKDMQQAEAPKQLTQNNFFTQIIQRASKEIQQINEKPIEVIAEEVSAPENKHALSDSDEGGHGNTPQA